MKQKVLICEDDEALAEMIQEQLKTRGLESVIAGTMADAKALLTDEIWAVTMDGQLPLRKGTQPSFADMLVEDMLKHHPRLAGRIFALAGSYDNRDRLLLAGAIGAPGRRGEDEMGTIKPYIFPVLDQLAELAKE